MSEARKPKVTKLQKGKGVILPKVPEKPNKSSKSKGLKGSEVEYKINKKTLKARAKENKKPIYKRTMLFEMLNKIEDGCNFWFADAWGDSLHGIRPIVRNTIEVINPNGFSPYRKEQEEKFFKFYVIDIVESDKQYTYNKDDIHKEKELEKKGYIYLKSGNINYIYDIVRNNK